MPDRTRPNDQIRQPADQLDPLLDQAGPDRAGAADAIAEAATKTVLTIPGVARIEPGLRQAVRNLHRISRNKQPVQGTVHITTDDIVTAEVDITITDLRPAYDVAQDVRSSLAGLITEHGHTPGLISVAILNLNGDHQTLGEDISV